MTEQHKAELRDYNRAMLWQWDRLRGLTPAERVIAQMEADLYPDRIIRLGPRGGTIIDRHC